MGRPPGTTVFVGNISYGTTEEQLKEVFSQVGNVVSFRLMYDHESGKPKGYGFCEFEDKETALSARRNLNNIELNGRNLRVDLTDNDKQNAALAAEAASTPQSNLGGRNNTPAHAATAALHGGPVPSMEMMSLPQIHEIMVQLKQAVVKTPNVVREALLANPQLAHAVLQGQIMLGVVPPPPIMVPPQPPPQRVVPGAPVPPPMQPMPPPGMMPRAGMMPPPMPGQAPAPPPPPQAQPQAPQMSMLDNEQAATLNLVLSMTPQQIDQLAPDQREKVLQLQAAVYSQNAAAGGMPQAALQGQQQRPYR